MVARASGRNRLGLGERISGFGRCGRGATAVEFSILAMPFLMMIFAALQFWAMQLMQSTLTDALYQSAANPEPALLAGTKSAYQTILCNKTAFVATCNASIKLEMEPLQGAAAGARAITGGTFNAGSSNDVLLLRASTSVVQFVPFIPSFTAKSAVVFRRPL